MNPYIYQIENIENGFVYIGSSTMLPHRRWAVHLARLRNRHHNPIIQTDYEIFGEDAFRFTVLKALSKEDDVGTHETHFITTTKSRYNMQRVAATRKPSVYSHKEKWRTANPLEVRDRYRAALALLGQFTIGELSKKFNVNYRKLGYFAAGFSLDWLDD